jgi:general stress protein 26
MKYFIILFLIAGSISCTDTQTAYRTNFSKKENTILKEARTSIEATNFVSLITIDDEKRPRARVMEFFKPDGAFEIWMGTNPKSRKVRQIQNNAITTLHFFDQNQMAYVSLMGKAYIVNDKKIKTSKWKDGWEKFYPNKTTDYMLIRFVPEELEFIGIVKGFTGDKKTWAPHRVVLRN